MKISNKNIGSERIASALGTVNDLGLLCEQSGIPEPEVIDRMNQKIMYAEEYLRIIYDAFEKDKELEFVEAFMNSLEQKGWNTQFRLYSPLMNEYESYNSRSPSINLTPVILKSNRQ